MQKKSVSISRSDACRRSRGKNVNNQARLCRESRTFRSRVKRRSVQKEREVVVDVFSSDKRSEIMSRVKGRGNHATELRLVALFRKHDLTGWRRHLPLFGSPDFVFYRSR